jgi:hypothetical protein
MARKELWVSIIGYNLIRSLTVGTSNIYKDFCPRKLSFKTVLSIYLEVLRTKYVKNMTLITELVKNEKLRSKYRREPRAIKKRNNRYCLLTTSRKESLKQEWGYSRRKGSKGPLFS